MLCVTIGRAVANAPAALAVASLGCVLLAGSARAATPTLTYDVAGSDTYAVGDADAQSQITYRGTQTLAIRREGGKTFFDASIRYTRVDQGATSSAKATFSAEVSADGEQHDLEDDDPDYLTVLNQPFAVQLDPQTLRDLAHLQAVVPFSFASPLTGSMLHGRLRRAGAGPVDGMQATGVGFDAEGPMSGALPGPPEPRDERSHPYAGDGLLPDRRRRAPDAGRHLDRLRQPGQPSPDRPRDDRLPAPDPGRRFGVVPARLPEASQPGARKPRNPLISRRGRGAKNGRFRTAPHAGVTFGPSPRATQVAPAATPSDGARAARSAPSVDRFETIVDEYQRRLYGFALRMTGNREDAEEIVQDAFVRAYPRARQR